MEAVYFELNNWMETEDYPDAEPFVTWLDESNFQFRDEDWVKENRLCVVESIIDMSNNFCISAEKEWVRKNCPELLTKYTAFLRFPDESGNVYGRFGDAFLKYSEENIGYVWNED